MPHLIQTHISVSTELTRVRGLIFYFMDILMFLSSPIILWFIIRDVTKYCRIVNLFTSTCFNWWNSKIFVSRTTWAQFEFLKKTMQVSSCRVDSSSYHNLQGHIRVYMRIILKNLLKNHQNTICQSILKHPLICM